MKHSDAHTIALRYARAWLSQATSDSGVLLADLATLKQAWEQSPSLQAAMTNPLIPAAQKTAAMLAVAKAAKASEPTIRGLRLLGKNQRLAILPQIIESVQALALAAQGEVPAQLNSATELNASQRDKFKAIFEKILGKKLRLNYTRDASLLGGVALQAQGKLIDASLAGQLQRLRLALHQAVVK